MAEPGPIPAPEAEPPQPEASPAEVRSKLGTRKNVAPAGASDRAPQVDRNFDRQPVFLVMTSGQIESAEVSHVPGSLCRASFTRDPKPEVDSNPDSDHVMEVDRAIQIAI